MYGPTHVPACRDQKAVSLLSQAPSAVVFEGGFLTESGALYNPARQAGQHVPRMLSPPHCAQPGTPGVGPHTHCGDVEWSFCG